MERGRGVVAVWELGKTAAEKYEVTPVWLEQKDVERLSFLKSLL
jgi:hypothetical protein